MEIDRRLLASLLGLVAVLGILGWLCWARWPHEYSGTLRCNRNAGIPEDPPPFAYLVTASGTYELAFSGGEIARWNSNWRYKVQEMEGKEVIIHGRRPTWRRRGNMQSPVIRVYDVALSPSTTTMSP